MYLCSTNNDEMERKLNRKDKELLYAKASDFFVDIAKLVFAGAILSGILKEDVGLWWLVLCGTVTVVLALLLAYYLFQLSRINKNK